MLRRGVEQPGSSSVVTAHEPNELMGKQVDAG